MLVESRTKGSGIKEKILMIFFAFSLIVFTIPRSLDAIVPKVYDIINVFKIFIVLFMVLLTIKRKIKLSKLTKNVILYSIYLFIVTLVNKVSLTVFLKVYLLNIGILLFCEILLNSKYKNMFIRFYSKYFFILLVLNLVGIIFGFIKGNQAAFLVPEAKTYLLGQDNRFILYIIPTLIGYYYLYEDSKSKKMLAMLVMTYFIGLISLILLWSVSAFCVLILLGVAFILSKFIKKKININVFLIILLIICVAIVFFRVQNLFEFLIVDVLHKSLDLSYRTIIWDDAINMLRNSTINLIFGFGYFDTINTFTNIPLRVNHLHNIVMNPIFFSGIIGTIIYFYNFYMVGSSIHKLNKVKNSNTLAIIFLALFTLMIFDTFELYQIYYFILFLLFNASDFLNQKKMVKDKEYEVYTGELQDNKVGIMLATYNGEKYIKEQLDSIIKQTHTNWVIYISDDNSTDETINILNEYKEKLKEKMVILSNQNKFSNAKLNFANIFTKVDNMDYYMFCDQDDVWDENKIVKLLKAVKCEEDKNEIPILAYCDSKVVDSNLNIIDESLVEYSNKHLPEKNLMKHVLLENYFPGCAVMFNGKLKEKVRNIYSECEMHDWWLTLVGAFCGKIIYIDEPLHLYRQHTNNTIGAKKDKNILQTYFTRMKKLFKFADMHNTWKKYQQITLKQAEELQHRYKNEQNENIEIINKFIEIMKTKNKIKRFILLLKNKYIPSEKVRIFRLVI